MIKGIYQTGKYLTVSNGTATNSNIYYNNYGSLPSGAQSFAGQVRYNASSHNMEVFDGNTWQVWNNTIASIGLTSEAEKLLDWAYQKMSEEQKIHCMAEKYPAVKDLKEKLDMVMTLVQESEASEKTS